MRQIKSNQKVQKSIQIKSKGPKIHSDQIKSKGPKIHQIKSWFDFCPPLLVMHDGFDWIRVLIRLFFLSKFIAKHQNNYVKTQSQQIRLYLIKTIPIIFFKQIFQAFRFCAKKSPKNHVNTTCRNGAACVFCISETNCRRVFFFGMPH